jgi:hypothetical protein
MGAGCVCSCRVRCDPPTCRIRVGEEARLTVLRFDAHGNALASSSALTKLRVKVSGPGPATATVLEQLNGTSQPGASGGERKKELTRAVSPRPPRPR